jgi:hypothetical protein
VQETHRLARGQFVFRHHQAAGRGIVLLAGIAGRDGAALSPGAARPAVERGVGADAFVLGEGSGVALALRHGHRHDLVVETPAAQAAAARWWLRTAYASASSRGIAYSFARFSAVSIIPEMRPKRSAGCERSRPRSSRSCSVTDPARAPQRIEVE